MTAEDRERNVWFGGTRAMGHDSSSTGDPVVYLGGERLQKWWLCSFWTETYADGPSRPRTGLSLEDRRALWANAMFSLEGCGVGYGRLVVLEFFFFFFLTRLYQAVLLVSLKLILHNEFKSSAVYFVWETGSNVSFTGAVAVQSLGRVSLRLYRHIFGFLHNLAEWLLLSEYFWGKPLWISAFSFVKWRLPPSPQPHHHYPPPELT